MQRDTAMAGASDVGALLRQTRVSFGQSLADVARDIRIRQSFLEAIEAGRFDTLPGQAYTVGFIRTYAEHLGLDPGEVVRRFKRESGVGKPAAKLNFPSPLAEGGVPKAAVMLLGAIIALVGYGIWYLTSSRYLDVAELALPLPEHLRQILPGAADGEAGTDAPQVALPRVEVPLDGRAGQPPAPAAEPAPTARAPTLPTMAAPAAPDPATPPAGPGSPGQSSQAVAPHGDPPAAPPATPPPVAAAPGPAAAAAEGGGRVVLRATADAWVEIRDPASRSVLLSRLMKAGESYAVPDRPGLTLLTGNAGGVEVVIDGEFLAPLGRPGTVRRGIPLDAEQLRVSLAPAAAPN
jgi:cytoskeleton protein RodZ